MVRPIGAYINQHQNSLSEQVQPACRTKSAKLEETEEASWQNYETLVGRKFSCSSLATKFSSKAYKTFVQLKTHSYYRNESIIRWVDQVNRLSNRPRVKDVVKGPQVNNIGGAEELGKTLLETVPTSAKLIADAKILSKDISEIDSGNKSIFSYLFKPIYLPLKTDISKR